MSTKRIINKIKLAVYENKLNKIAKEFGLTIVRDYDARLFSGFQHPRIIIGNYDGYPDAMIGDFFHEIGHWLVATKFNTAKMTKIEIELEAWHCGWQVMVMKGFRITPARAYRITGLLTYFTNPKYYAQYMRLFNKNKQPKGI